MSATSKTPNYNLPVYRDYDVTSYLQDFNGAMEKIDDVLKGLSDEITGGGGVIGVPEDYMATNNTTATIRNNQAGSTTALLTIKDVQPAKYSANVYVEADTSALTADDIYGEVTIAVDGALTTYKMKLIKTTIANTYSFTAPINVPQKGFVTLEVGITSDIENALTISQAAMSLQKLDV